MRGAALEQGEERGLKDSRHPRPRAHLTRYFGVFAPAFAARAEIVPVGQIEYGWPDHLSPVRLIRTFRVLEPQVNSGQGGCHDIDRA